MEISSREYPSRPQKETEKCTCGSAPGAAANWAFNEEWIKRQFDIHYFPYRRMKEGCGERREGGVRHGSGRCRYLMRGRLLDPNFIMMSAC